MSDINDKEIQDTIWYEGSGSNSNLFLICFFTIITILLLFKELE